MQDYGKERREIAIDILRTEIAADKDYRKCCPFEDLDELDFRIKVNTGELEGLIKK